jgi:outer membrane protein TolC
MKLLRIAALLLALAALASGRLRGPHYKRPELKSMPETWSEPLQGGVEAGPPQLAQWWKSFGDATLDSLVSRAVESNFDLRIAKARVREARAAERMAESSLWPQLNGSGGYQRLRGVAQKSDNSASTSGSVNLSKNGVGLSATEFPMGLTGPSVTVSPDLSGGGNSSVNISSPLSATKIPKRQTDLYRAGLDATWEIDVFGGIRREVEASKADVQATEESLRDVLVTLADEVARTYFDLREAESSLDIANNNIQIQRQVLTLARARFEAGPTSAAPNASSPPPPRASAPPRPTGSPNSRSPAPSPDRATASKALSGMRTISGPSGPASSGRSSTRAASAPTSACRTRVRTRR